MRGIVSSIVATGALVYSTGAGAIVYGVPDGTAHPEVGALLASGQITMRKVDGWQTLAEKPAALPIDLAA